MQVTAAILATLQLALLVLWAPSQSFSTGASISSATLNVVVAIQILCLSWAEDSRSVRPSVVLTVYLLFTLLLDFAQARTLWLQGANTAIAAVFSASIALKLVLLVLESQSKRSFLTPSHRDLPPESTSGVLSRGVLWWLNGLLARGYRALLPFDALYVLDKDLVTDCLAGKIRRVWETRKVPERRLEYPWAAARALWWPFLQAVIPRLFLLGFTFAQLFLISAALDLLSQPYDRITKERGYGLVGATVLVYVGLAISALFAEHRLYRMITMFRGVTVSLIYDHALQIQNGVYDESAAITLMSADADRLTGTLEKLMLGPCH